MNTKKYVALVVGIPLLLIYLSVGPPVYFAKEIEGVIVDQRTGEPLQGVVVVAEWQLYEFGFGHAHHGSRINTIEAITDGNGTYHIPWWGPRLRPPWARLLDRAPMMTFFKSGYYPIAVSNKKESANLVLSSDYHKRVMKLEKFDGDFKRLSEALLLTEPGTGGCWWACPLYVLALDAEAKRLRKIVPQVRDRDYNLAFPRELEDLVEFERSYFLRYVIPQVGGGRPAGLGKHPDPVMVTPEPMTVEADKAPSSHVMQAPRSGPLARTPADDGPKDPRARERCQKIIDEWQWRPENRGREPPRNDC